MVRFLIRAVIFLGTAALGLVAAAAILPEFNLSPTGFITAVIVFAIAQSLLAPLVTSLTKRYADALTGGVGLISTFVALFVATLFPDGLQITGIAAWVIGTLIVWLVTALGAWVLPLLFLKKTRENDAK